MMSACPLFVELSAGTAAVSIRLARARAPVHVPAEQVGLFAAAGGAR